jgi:hypothetical protein
MMPFQSLMAAAAAAVTFTVTYNRGREIQAVLAALVSRFSFIHRVDSNSFPNVPNKTQNLPAFWQLKKALFRFVGHAVWH